MKLLLEFLNLVRRKPDITGTFLFPQRNVPIGLPDGFSIMNLGIVMEGAGMRLRARDEAQNMWTFPKGNGTSLPKV